MIYKKKLPLEHDIQVAFFDWVRLAEKMHPALQLVFAVPNCAKRGYALAARMVKEGLRAGVPDVMLPVARQGFVGLAIEFKRTASTKPSDVQLEYIGKLVKENWLVVVLADSEAAIKTVKNYLGIA